MRVALNGSFLRPPATGSGQYTLQLIRELDRLLDEPLQVIWPAGGSGLGATRQEPGADFQPLIGGTRARLIPVAAPVLRHPHLTKVWFEQVGFPRAAQAARAAIAHVPYFGPPYRSSLPVVVTIHDLIMMVLPEHRGPLAVRLYTWLAGRSAQRARLVLTDSDCSRRDVIDRLGIPADRIRVIPLACDERFRPDVDGAAIEKARRDYNLDRPYVFYLGGFDWRKNVPGLIAAFGRVPTDCLLAIGGAVPPGDPLFPDPRDAIRRTPAAERIRLIGRVAEADKPALYAGAEVFVFPSRYEGFGLTVLEALACGTPVVCSNAASLPEVAGEAALLVEPDDLAGLAEAIGRVLTDPERRADLRARGLRRAARFTWRRTAEATLAAYREVASGV